MKRSAKLACSLLACLAFGAIGCSSDAKSSTANHGYTGNGAFGEADLAADHQGPSRAHADAQNATAQETRGATGNGAFGETP